MQHAQRIEPVAQVFTHEDLIAAKAMAFREGYGAGADATQLEQRNRPFLIEDEAVEQWLQQQ